MRAIALALALLALTGCASFEGVSFGLDLANADTTVSLRQGDGKTVLAAEQDGQRVSGFFSR